MTIEYNPRSSVTTVVNDRIRLCTTSYTTVYGRIFVVYGRISSYYLPDDLRPYFVVNVYDEIRRLTMVVNDRMYVVKRSYTAP